MRRLKGRGEGREPDSIDNVRDQMLERPLPHSADAERALLAAILLDNGAMIEARAKIRRLDIFYIRAHQFIFGAMVELHEEQSEINPLLIGEKLRVQGYLEQVGGISFISEVSFGVPHFQKLAPLIKIIRDKWLRRQIIKVANRITTEALEEEMPEDELLNFADAHFLALQEERGASETKLISAKQVAEEARDYFRHIRAGENPAISTGIKSIDVRTRGGIYPSELWLIAALEKQGKSALAKQIFQAVAKAGIPAIYFTREMPALQLALRMIAAESNVPTDRMNAYGSDHDLSRAEAAIEKIEGLPIWFNDSTSNINEARALIRSLARRLEQEGNPLRLIVGDYFQLFESRDNPSVENRTQELAQIARGWKAIAGEFNCGMILIAQFNNKAGEAQFPSIKFVEGGGEVRKACDLAAVLHTKEPKAGDGGARRATFFIELYRHGAAGSKDERIPLLFDGTTQEFFMPPEGSSADDDEPELVGEERWRE